MKASPKNIIRKLSAGFFFGLLVFVYAEKALHVHELPATKTQQAGITSAINNPICSICDFTLSKEAELAELPNLELSITFLVKQYIVATSTYYYLPDNFLSGRGPPLSYIF